MALEAAIQHEGDKLLVQTGYNVVLVRILNTLPRTEAVYRSETKIWYIDIKHEGFVLKTLQTLGYAITEVDRSVPTGDDCYSVLGLLPTATWEVCEAAYRALAMVNHPDKGGNLETMQQINAAFDKVRIIRGKK